jgi:transposase-like protein
MGKQRKQYTDEFKRDAVRMMRDRGTRTVAQVADDLGVSTNLMHRWAQKFERDAVAKRNAEGETIDQEVRRLRKEVEQLRMEKAILKNRRGRRPTCWARSSCRATTAVARKERPAAFWRSVPVKKHGPGSAADLALVTPSGDPV